MLWNMPVPNSARLIANPAYDPKQAGKMVIDPTTGKLTQYKVPKTIIGGGTYNPVELPGGQTPDMSKLKNYIKNFGPVTGIPLFGDKSNTPSQLSPLIGSQRTGSTAAVNIASLTGPSLPPLR